jgi:MFS transporter, Spinster family, sphingosine-1-phosphate transporter
MIMAGAYIVGYTIAAPILAQLVAFHKPIRVMCIGLTVWTLSVVLTGVSFEFGLMLVARTLSGVGEASFLVVAPTFIDVFAPPAERSRWLSWFYVTIPVGYALGVVASGNWIGGNLEGSEWTWRMVFLFEAVAMLPLIAMFLSVDGPDSVADLDPEARERLANRESESGNNGSVWGIVKRIFGEIKEIVSNPTYDCIVLGYAFQTFVIGGFSYYGDEYAKDAIHLSDSKASICKHILI